MFALMCKIKSVGALNTMEMRSTFLHRIFSTSDKVQLEHLAQRERAIFSLKNEVNEFTAVFPDVVNDLTEFANKYGNQDAVKWYEKALQYNVPCGSKYRGMIPLLTFKEIADKSQLTPENIKLLHYLGWCNLMFGAGAIIMDDVQDEDPIRRGRKCWHTVDDVNMYALNDVFTIWHGLYFILKKHFEQKDCYIDLVELFHNFTCKALLGQSLDMRTSKQNVLTFTMDRYKVIADNKANPFVLHLPIMSAAHLAGIRDPEFFEPAETLLNELAYFLQVQNDYFDCYNNPKITGKKGTDIQSNKCTWLAVVCMERASEEQKEIMQKYYGKNDPAKISKVKQLYTELELPKIFAEYKNETYNKMKRYVQMTSNSAFPLILDKIFCLDQKINYY